MHLLCERPPGTMLRDQQLPSSAGGFHPHLFDAYIPNGPIQFVVVALHGGNGGKAFIPQVLGVTYAAEPTVRQVNWNLLDRFNTALIVPQGQHCDGTIGPFNPNGANTVTEMNPQGVATWSNYSMWSGADDVAMLKDLALWITQQWSGVARVLMGHSNGGMMAHRMWLEAPGYFNLYASFCGPMPQFWDQAPIPQPSQLKPMLVRYSLQDSVLGILDGRAGAGNHFWQDSWLQQPEQFSVAAFTWPVMGGWVAGWRSFAAQVEWMGKTFASGDATTTSEAIGQRMTWAYKQGALTYSMDLLTAGSHSLVDQTKATRRYVMYDLMMWCIGALT